MFIRKHGGLSATEKEAIKGASSVDDLRSVFPSHSLRAPDQPSPFWTAFFDHLSRELPVEIEGPEGKKGTVYLDLNLQVVPKEKPSPKK